MKVQRRNVVRLVGYCYEIAHKVMPYNGEHVFARVEERALCFEYLQGGSLDKHLSGTTSRALLGLQYHFLYVPRNDCVDVIYMLLFTSIDESSGFSWGTRYNIIKGICEGLNYLHNGTKDPIYHLDLKPKNILLDKNMMPKIGDFGLSRLADSTQTCTTKEIRGTLLGVIIIQIMTGRDGYSRCGDMPSHEFIDLVRNNWLKRQKVTSSSHTSREVKTCIKIALRCVEADRVKWPSIAEIVAELDNIYFGGCSFADQEESALFLGMDTGSYYASLAQGMLMDLPEARAWRVDSEDEDIETPLMWSYS
uniref:Uncharacterized protein n=1 Tax=Avena sativa TaxID=4498 RepID=A0ACD5VIT7_AVESA